MDERNKFITCDMIFSLKSTKYMILHDTSLFLQIKLYKSVHIDIKLLLSYSLHLETHMSRLFVHAGSRQHLAIHERATASDAAGRVAVSTLTAINLHHTIIFYFFI